MSSSLALAWKIGDITLETVDVIVNAANPGLLGGGGVDGAIHAAGGPEILAACRRRKLELPDGLLPRGKAVATPAGRLNARWVVHTAGPIWSAEEDRSAVLASCYTQCLRLSAVLGAQSIAFPAISAGVYGWPLDDAARIAVETVRSWPAVSFPRCGSSCSTGRPTPRSPARCVNPDRPQRHRDDVGDINVSRAPERLRSPTSGVRRRVHETASQRTVTSPSRHRALRPITGQPWSSIDCTAAAQRCRGPNAE